MDILTILEHQKIYIANKTDVSKKTISYQDAKYLKLLEQKQGKSLFDWGYNHLNPKQWVGVISTPTVTIEILPKTVEDEKEDVVRKYFLTMLRIAHNVPVRKDIIARLSYGRNGFLEILISIFLNELNKQMKRGLTKSYVKQTKNVTALKGSVDFTRQLSVNGLNETKFYCTYSTLTKDNKLNQVIKTTLQTLYSLSKSSKNKQQLKSMLHQFNDVSDISFRKNVIQEIHFDRNNSRFKEVIQFCEMFMIGSLLELKAGKTGLTFMLFDMNVIFEKFIANLLKKAYRGAVSYQTKTHLLENRISGSKKVLLRPDVRIKPHVVIDTKWKLIKGTFASEKDIYQMIAYSVAIRDVQTLLLLYPKSVKNDKMIGEYTIQNERRPITIKIKTVDLTKASEPPFIDYIKELLDS